MRRHLAAFTALALVACARAPERPNIVLITLDTTRADHLGCFGFDRPTSPALDRLAQDAMVFTEAYATSSWTLPTHASIFTGKLPSAHGAQYDSEGPLDLTQGLDPELASPAWKRYRVRPLAAGEITLAGILARQGYATGGVAGGPWLEEIFGLGEGFASWDDENIGSLEGRPAADVTRAALAFVEEHAGEPFFLFANYYDPHEPFLPSEADVRAVLRSGEEFAALSPEDQKRVQYAAEIRGTDREIGVLFDRLRALGLYESAWILVVADHGQLLGDDYLGAGPMGGHGHTLSQAEIHVPLIVKFPGGEPRGQSDARIQQIDLMPLILERLGLPLPPGVQGSSPLAGDAFVSVAHPIVAEVYPVQEIAAEGDWRYRGDWRVLIDGAWKYAWNSANGSTLVDLSADPGERTNLLVPQSDRARRMERALTDYVEGLPEPGAAGSRGDLDADTIEALRNLGYLEGR